MKRNWKTRLLAGFVAFLMMVSLVPTGVLSDLVPQIVPDTAVEAEAALKDFGNVNGLFRIKDSATGLYMTASAGNGYNVQVKWQAYSESNRGQCWLINSTTYADAKIRPLTAVWAYANDRSGHGDMWLRRLDDLNLQDTTRVWSYAQADGGTHSADSGNPTGNQWTWRFTQGGGGLGIATISGDTFGAYLSNPDAYYYIYNNGGIVDQTSSSNYTYLHFEPTYDPDMNYNGPLVIGNQPDGGTSYWMKDTNGTISMPQGVGKAEDNATQDQTWALVKSSKGYFYIVNRSTGKYLGANASGVLSTAVSTGESYQWQVFKQRDDGEAGALRIVNKYTGRTLYYSGSPSAAFISNPQDMHQYMTLSYNRQFASDNLWSNYYISSFNSGSSIYWPATFDNKSYISMKLNYIQDVNGKGGYLFHTAATNSPTGITSLSTSTVKGYTEGYVQNTAVQGFDYSPPAYDPDVGNVRVKFSFKYTTGMFLIIEGFYAASGAGGSGGTTSVTIKDSSGTTKASGSQAGYGRKEISLSGLTNGTTYTLELSGGEHYGIFTTITPNSASGTPSMDLTGGSGVIHGDKSYSLKITNPRNQAISKINFTVTVKDGSTTVATLTYNNGTVTGNNTYATLSGGSSQIAGGGNATWTIKLLYSGLTAGHGYTVSIGSNGSCYAFSGNAAPSNPGITRDTETFTATKCNGGSVSATVTTNVDKAGVVNGKVTYTIKIKNGCNHAVTGIDFTFGNSSYTILKVENGIQKTKHSAASVSGLANSIGANSELVITVVVDYTEGINGYINDGNNTSFQFKVSSGSAASGCSSAKTFSSTNTTSVTEASYGVKVEVSSSVDNKAIVRGKVVYTIKFTNSANHDVNKVDFTLKTDKGSLLTITNGEFKKATGVTTDVDALSTIAKNGGTATVVVTVDTTKLAAATGFTISTSGGYCEATGLVAGTRGITITGTGTVQTITTASGTGVTVSGSSNITTNSIVAGNYTFTATVSNGANHYITAINYSIFDGNTEIVKVTNGKVNILVDYVTKVSTTNLGNVANGSSVGLTLTLDTTQMDPGSSHTLTIGDVTCKAHNISGQSSDYELTAKTDYSHTSTVRKGNVTMTWEPSIPAGSVVEGTYTYKVTFTNGTNHKITGIDYIIKYGNTSVLEVTNGKVNAFDCASVKVSEIDDDLNPGESVELLVTIDTTELDDKGEYTFILSGGSCSTDGVAGKDFNSTLTPTTNSYSHNIIVRGGNVVLDWSSIASNKVVEGIYTFNVTFKNEGNHKVVGVDYVIKVNNTEVIKVTNGGVNVLVDYISVDKNTVSDLVAGATDTLQIEVDTTKLTDGSNYTFDLVGGTATANGIVGSNSGIELNSNANKSHVITIREGNIFVGIAADSVVDGGVAEGDTSYTITLENRTNHTLKDIAFVVKDSNGNTLLTVASNGKITVVSDLVKNGGTINGSLTGLTEDGVVTISGIIIDADADVLDETGRLILKVTATANSSDVVGSAADVPYSMDSANFTIMVRHDVNLMVQANTSTTINASTIFAAMDKSGAYATEKANGLAANTISKIEIVNGNGAAATVTGVTAKNASLVFVLGAKHVEYVIKVTYSGGTVLVPIQTSSYNAGALVQQVLDYGLPVTLTGSSLMADVTTSDGGFLTTTGNFSGVATAMGNASATTVNAVSGIAKIEGGNLTYTPNKFMDGIDNLYAVIRVATATATTANVDYVDIYKHIQMIPANVIYYEDTFPAINYLIGNTITEIAGAGGVSTGQSAGNGNYGFDDGAYASSSDVTISGLSVKKINITEQGVVATFSFTGTGFELLSRCNAFDSATIIVRLKAQDTDAWKYYPVITTFDHNNDGGEEEVYQVPVFRIQDLAYGNYDIEIVGLPRQDFNENGEVISTELTYLYVDGVRIFNPVAPENAPDAYGEQAGVTFGNVSTMVKDGKVTVATYSDSKVTGFVTGNYFFVENYDGLFETNMGDVNALNAIGANNEIYINGNAGNYALVFKVKPTGNSVLQVGFRDVHDGKFMGTSNTNNTSTVWYGTASNTWIALRTGFTHGTEQYYSIDLSNCPLGDDGYYTVVLKVAGFVSFTSIKSKNLDFMTTASVAAGSLLNYNDDGTITVQDTNGNESTINTNAFFDIKHIEELAKSPVVAPIGSEEIG